MNYQEAQTKVESTIKSTQVKVAEVTTLTPERQKQVDAVIKLSTDLLKASIALTIYLLSIGYTRIEESVEDLKSNPNFKPKENARLWVEYFQYQLSQLTSTKQLESTSTSSVESPAE